MQKTKLTLSVFIALLLIFPYVHAVELKEEIAYFNETPISYEAIADFISRSSGQIVDVEALSLLADAQKQQLVSAFVIERRLLNRAWQDATIRARLDNGDLHQQLLQQRDALLIETHLARVAAAAVTSEAVQQRYDAMVTELEGEQEYHLQHIVLDDVDRALAVQELLSNGSDFAEVAREYTANDDNRDSGGDLGFVAGNVLADPIQQALQTMQQGDVSEAIAIDDRYHFIKLLDARPITILPLDQVAQSIAAQLREAQRQVYLQSVVAPDEITIAVPVPEE